MRLVPFASQPLRFCDLLAQHAFSQGIHSASSVLVARAYAFAGDLPRARESIRLGHQDQLDWWSGVGYRAGKVGRQDLVEEAAETILRILHNRHCPVGC